jgi:methionyl-tRNA formyltransferase/LmbE family N-acetylglucosaminyl deacetylase
MLAKPQADSESFLYLGGVEEGQFVLHALLQRGWRPKLILALNDESLNKASGGRPWVQEDWPGVPLVKVTSFMGPAGLLAMAGSGCRGALAVGISEILGKDCLNHFPLGVYGFHGSLLPELAGPAPANWAILQGLSKTGTSLLRYTEDLDGGTLVAQAECPLDDTTTVKSLYEDLSRLSAELWLTQWPRIAEGAVEHRPLGRLRLNLRRRPEDGLIQWKDQDAALLSRQIRALGDPYPGAYFWVDGRRVWVHRASRVDGPGMACARLTRVDQDGLIIALPGGTIQLADLRDDEGNSLDPVFLTPRVGSAMAALHAGRTVLAIVAHPDDEVLGLGGTLIRHFKAGDEVHVRIVCSGDPIRYAKGEQDQAADSERAAYYLGSDTKGLQFPDQRLDSGTNLGLIQAVEAEVQTLKPHIVYTHFWGDVNADHARIAEAVDVAVRPYNAPSVHRVLAFETPSSTEWTLAARSGGFHPNVFVDIHQELDRKIDSMRAYASELRPYPHPRSLRSLREHAGARGSECGFQAAEDFALLRELR